MVNIGDKVCHGNLKGEVFLIVYPTMRALVKLARNGTKRLIDMDELEPLKEGKK